MIINEEGTYTLKYTATDECGKSSTVDRELVVTDNSPRRTVLYTDGTFIINERQVDEAHNIELHGVATNVYAPFDPNGATAQDRYVFSTYNVRPWDSQKSNIKSVEIGSKISPTSTAYWFGNLFYVTEMDLTNLDTSMVTDMTTMFGGCVRIQSLDVSHLDTASVTTMASMFDSCEALTSLDLSNFDTSNVTVMTTMFSYCKAITTIYASDKFVVDQVDNSNGMFRDMSRNLIGGAGTVWSSSYVDKTYAHIDGGTSNPGYFTAKS